MLETITSYIEEHKLLPESGTLIVAVSGGADSLCLLHLLLQLCGPGKRYPTVELHVAHLNHKLRKDASTQDANAVAQLAASWGVPVTIGEIDVPLLAQQERRSLEDAARVARYRFLREVAQGGRIAVAHHADDQVETLLLHWLRGGGLGSMVGMLPRQQDIIRPLLQITHAETIHYCQQHQITPVEDASNNDPRFLRNRIRHELLPLLESLNPGIQTTLLRNAAVMATDLGWIETQVNNAWAQAVSNQQNEAIQLKPEFLLTLPLSIQRHLLRRVTAQLCGGQSPLELRHFQLIEEFLNRQNKQADKILHLPGQLQVIYNVDNLIFKRFTRQEHQTLPVFSKTDTDILLPVPGRVQVTGTPWIAQAERVPDALMSTIRQALIQEDWREVWRLLPATRYAVYINAETIGDSLWIRTRRPGDRIQPLGMTQEKKVQDVLVNKHIPHAERAEIPLFFSSEHCVWLAGVCLDHRVRLTSKTEHIVFLSINPADEPGLFNAHFMRDC